MRVQVLLLLVVLMMVPHVGAVDSNEPNDTPETATQIYVNSTISADLTPNDEDYFEVPTNFTGGLTLNISSQGIPMNIAIEVDTSFSANYYHYVDTYVVFNHYINIAIKLVKIHIIGLDPTPYSIIATALIEKELEQNYSIESKTNLTMDEFTGHTLVRSTGDQYFGFTVENPGMTRVSILSPDNALQIQLYQSLGNSEYKYYGFIPLYEIFGDGYSRLLNLTAGDYYFMVSSQIGTFSASFYETWITQDNVDLHEVSGIIALEPNQPVYGTISPDDADEFSFEYIVQGAIILEVATDVSYDHLVVNDTGQTTDPYVEVFTKSDKTLIATGSSLITFDGPDDSLLINIKSSKVTVDYILSMTYVFKDQYEDVGGNSQEDALSLEVDYDALSIHRSDDVDWFYIDLHDSANATLTLNFVDEFPPVFDIYDHAGNQVEGVTKNTSSYVSFAGHLTSDTYYIKVTGLHGLVITYDINIRFNFDPTTEGKKGKIPGFELPVFLIAVVVMRQLRKTHTKSI